MSALNKCILGLFALLCLLQCIEMSPIPREVAENNTGTADAGELGDAIVSGVNGDALGSAIDSLIERLKAVLEHNALKDLLSSTKNMVPQS